MALQTLGEQRVLMPELVQTMLVEFDDNIVIFNGGKEEWKGYDQYVDRCKGGGIHLHVYGLGSYRGCYRCRFQEGCRSYAHCCGEQAEL